MKNKIYIIGWDGATWDLLKKFVDMGIMPNLKSLMGNGVYGKLRSSYPPVTPPAWASFLTGKNPGKHNVYEFFDIQGHSSDLRINNSKSIKSKIIWEYLSDFNYTHIISGIPLSYPFRKINGIYIGDFMIPFDKVQSNFSEVIKEIERRFGEYKLYPSEVFYPGNERNILLEALEHLQYHLKVQQFLSENYDWDVFFYYYNISDRLQHEIWHLLDESHPLFNKKVFNENKNLIYEFYNLLDSSIKIYSDNFSNVDFLLLSDHGFGPVKHTVSINMYLLKKGYLNIRKNILSFLRYFLFSLGLTPLSIYNLLSFFKLGNIRLKRYRKNINKSVIEKIAKFLFFGFDDIDWNRAYAFSRGNMGQIYFNKEKIDKKIIERLKDDLYSLNYKGFQLIEEILDKHDLFNGPYMDSAPDLYLILKDASYNLNAPLDFIQNKCVKEISRYAMSGAHRLDGIYAMQGKSIKKNTLLNAKIIDLAPTILYILDSFFTPNDFDGRILNEAFEDFDLSKAIKNYAEEYKHDESRNNDNNNANQDVVKDRLKELGYI